MQKYALPRQKQTILWRELAGEAVLLDPALGCSYTLNPVGTLIWKMLDGQQTLENIVAVLCDSYEVEPEQAHQDIERLLADLRANQLVIDVSTNE